MRYSFIITLSLLSQIACADEYTVEPKPFKTETTLKAVFLPVSSQAIRIKPEIWTDFTITSLVDHGAAVKKGDRLIGIDTRDLDKKITTMEKSITTGELHLAQTRHDLEQLKITTPRSLETHARTEQETADDLKWYTSTGQPQEIEQAKRNVTKAEFTLTAQTEELDQLLKMYNEDNKTEETEEIILKRARHNVDRAKFALQLTKTNAGRQINITIPRTLKSKQLAAENARIANADAKQKLPRALEIKQQEADKAAKDHQEKVDQLAKHKTDRAMMTITAPADGIIYYGEIKNGRWNPATATKALHAGSKLPAHSTLMTFIPTNTPLQLYSLTPENDRGAMREGDAGFASTELNRYQSFPVSITTIASHPDTDGSFLTVLKPTLPNDLPVVPGMKASARIITNKADQALIIPTDYLSDADDGGYSVKIKLADGKTADRKVTVGASNKEWIVITNGLDIGQVIVK